MANQPAFTASIDSRPARISMIWWILGLSAAYAVALNGTMVMPVIVLAMSKLSGYDEGLATIVASAELAGIAIYGIFLARLAARSWKVVAVAGLIAVAGGEAASFWLHELTVAPGDLDGFLAAAGELHASAPLRSELATNARIYAEATFPIAKTAAVFDRILAS